MKLLLANIGIIVVFFATYHLGLFDLFAGKYAFFASIMLVIVILLVGIAVIGNPFAKGKPK